ncbi:riboflavin synthase [Megamonas hypermegale]|jgi:riboflavin synthase|uniref:Riboflavin synthase n=1 Tax=Megamonas hypermegale TaxID=158847 RepID=A0A239TUX8_9FIRM|nr:riboflavin synthase [Megamonas hypermegale]OUO41030.1 riboflavin synthase [Megamonas hypermegale]SNV00674.1 Riboflavin synthase alpha chain [Megamonas hypermegale]HJG08185.1 riboflavin synthase [Megamonas hypermegale]
MFTGIIEEIGIIRNIVKGSRSIKLTITAKKVLENTNLGDSIAVNGVCLTVTALGKDGFTADVMPESMSKTNMGRLKPGDRVNLERALTLSSRLGGHIVSGHIDGVGDIINMEKDDNAVRVTLTSVPKVMKYIVSEGSVALDGVSLTVAHLGDNDFTVSLIPHTAQVTTLLDKKVGDKLNIENDVVGKYVERLLSFSDKDKVVEKNSAISLKFLRENGF